MEFCGNFTPGGSNLAIPISGSTVTPYWSEPRIPHLNPRCPPRREQRSRHACNGNHRNCRVSGAQQAFDLAARIFIDPGDSVAIEDPHHHRFREIYVSTGARVRAIPVDADGILVSELTKIRGVLRFVHVTPSHQFPSGAILSVQRRLALLSWAGQSGTYILEDDYDSEYRYDSRPIEALQAIDREPSSPRMEPARCGCDRPFRRG